jgi:AmiR/NasT family two-component response regulator
MLHDEARRLRILIANERGDQVQYVAGVVSGLGHEVIVGEMTEVTAAITRVRPDVVLVGVGSNSERALELISDIVRGATPVIAVLHKENPDFVTEAARRGIFAYVENGDSKAFQSALDITLCRFAEYQRLRGAFGRRAVIERAKGILMARHGIDEQRAFEMLRAQSRRHGRNLTDVAECVLGSHLLLR